MTLMLPPGRELERASEREEAGGSPPDVQDGVGLAASRMRLEGLRTAQTKGGCVNVMRASSMQIHTATFLSHCPFCPHATRIPRVW